MLASDHYLQPASACSLTVSAGQWSRRGAAKPSAQGLQPRAWCLQGCISSGSSAGADGLPGSSGQFPELLSLQSRVGASFASPVNASWVVPEVLPCGRPHSRSQLAASPLSRLGRVQLWFARSPTSGATTWGDIPPPQP